MASTNIRALTFFLVFSVVAAASHTSYFYTTDTVAASDIVCEEEMSQKKSENTCAAYCVLLGCYRFRQKNGMCVITKRNNISGIPSLIFKKVAFISIYFKRK